MKYYYRMIYVINGERLDEPRVEIYRINSNGVVSHLCSVWGDMCWIKNNYMSLLGVEHFENKFTSCTLKEVKQFFNEYCMY